MNGYDNKYNHVDRMRRYLGHRHSRSSRAGDLQPDQEQERMTDMGNVISVIVVPVFSVIVLRKRLAPFFKNRAKTDNAENVESASVDASALPDKGSGNVYINVFGIDAGA